MIGKRDKLQPIQPYFVLDTEDFYREIYLKQGISHFYSCHTNNPKDLRIVPDGCIDLFFEYYNGGMGGFVCGTPIQYKVEKRPEYHDIFGVRFMPGMQPELINVTMKELCDTRVDLKDVLKGESDWLLKLAEEKDFYQRIRIFLEAYTKAEKKKEKPFGKKELVNSIKRMVYESDGRVKISELANHSGYTERYINKVFIEEMGISPKTFCKIIQFQYAVQILSYDMTDKMTDVATNLGYYDQPQFIRDFKKYAGMTPKNYLKFVRGKDYKNKIYSRNCFINE